MPEQSFRQLFGLSHDVTVRINATNVCNIHCTHCDNDAHLPFSGNGELIHRKKPLVAKVDDIEAFCELLAGVGEDDPHLLTGGEITALPVATIVAYIDVLHRHGRKVGMRTNGYNVHGIPPEKLQLLDRIHLNSHGINSEAISASREYLDKHFRGTLIHEETLQHRDLRSIVRHGQGTIEQALGCDHLLSTLTVLPPVILPCCNTWALMNALNTNAMMDALVDAGWTIHNPDLVTTLRNWRTTLPREFLQTFCADSCYKTTSAAFPSYPIEAHPRDRVLKRIPIAALP
jgi:organic radical activating enzyme